MEMAVGVNIAHPAAHDANGGYVVPEAALVGRDIDAVGEAADHGDIAGSQGFDHFFGDAFSIRGRFTGPDESYRPFGMEIDISFGVEKEWGVRKMKKPGRIGFVQKECRPDAFLFHALQFRFCSVKRVRSIGDLGGDFLADAGYGLEVSFAFRKDSLDASAIGYELSA